MSNAITTRHLDDCDDDGDGYLMIDARALILDLPDEVRAATTRPPMRGAAARFGADSRLYGDATHAPRRVVREQLTAEAGATATVWARLGRRLQGLWPANTRQRERDGQC